MKSPKWGKHNFYINIKGIYLSKTDHFGQDTQAHLSSFQRRQNVCRVRRPSHDFLGLSSDKVSTVAAKYCL